MTADPDRLLLILDLDETLLHSSPTRLGRAEDFQLFDYFVYVRPHLERFLAECAARFRLAVWSSASDDYVAEIVRRLFPPPLALAFSWGRSRCTLAVDSARVQQSGVLEPDSWRRSRTPPTCGGWRSGTGDPRHGCRAAPAPEPPGRAGSCSRTLYVLTAPRPPTPGG